MVLLATIRNINQSRGLYVEQSVMDSGNIGGVIVKAAIRFNSNHWRFKAFELHYLAACILINYAFLLEPLNQRRDHIIVETLSSLVDSHV